MMPTPTCPACGYDLRDRSSDTCPECGTDWTPEQTEAWRRRNAAPFPKTDVVLHALGIAACVGFGLLALLIGLGYNARHFRTIGLILLGVAVVVAISLVALIRRIGRDRKAAGLHPEAGPDTPR